MTKSEQDAALQELDTLTAVLEDDIEPGHFHLGLLRAVELAKNYRKAVVSIVPLAQPRTAMTDTQTTVEETVECTKCFGLGELNDALERGALNADCDECSGRGRIPEPSNGVQGQLRTDYLTSMAQTLAAARHGFPTSLPETTIAAAVADVAGVFPCVAARQTEAIAEIHRRVGATREPEVQS